MTEINERHYCPRPECRAEWGAFRTLKIESNGRTTAFCHDWLGPRIEEHRLSADEAELAAMIAHADEIIADLKVMRARLDHEIAETTILRDEMISGEQ